MEYKEIENYLKQENLIGTGKEINAYKMNNKVINKKEF